MKVSWGENLGGMTDGGVFEHDGERLLAYVRASGGEYKWEVWNDNNAGRVAYSVAPTLGYAREDAVAAGATEFVRRAAYRDKMDRAEMAQNK